MIFGGGRRVGGDLANSAMSLSAACVVAGPAARPDAVPDALALITRCGRAGPTDGSFSAADWHPAAKPTSIAAPSLAQPLIVRGHVSPPVDFDGSDTRTALVCV